MEDRYGRLLQDELRLWRRLRKDDYSIHWNPCQLVIFEIFADFGHVFDRVAGRVPAHWLPGALALAGQPLAFFVEIQALAVGDAEDQHAMPTHQDSINIADSRLADIANEHKPAAKTGGQLMADLSGQGVVRLPGDRPQNHQTGNKDDADTK